MALIIVEGGIQNTLGLFFRILMKFIVTLPHNMPYKFLILGYSLPCEAHFIAQDNQLLSSSQLACPISWLVLTRKVLWA